MYIMHGAYTRWYMYICSECGDPNRWVTIVSVDLVPYAARTTTEITFNSNLYLSIYSNPSL